jgi:hypothetical protein
LLLPLISNSPNNYKNPVPRRLLLKIFVLFVRDVLNFVVARTLEQHKPVRIVILWQHLPNLPPALAQQKQHHQKSVQKVAQRNRQN